VCGSIERQDLGLGSERSEAYRFGRLIQEGLPVGRRPEHEHNHLVSLELAPAGVEPDDRFLLFRAQQDHVVIRRHDDLARPLGMIQNVLIRGSPSRSPVGIVAYPAGAIAEEPKRFGHNR
jgi:hypothetical protein